MSYSDLLDAAAAQLDMAPGAAGGGGVLDYYEDVAVRYLLDQRKVIGPDWQPTPPQAKLLDQIAAKLAKGT